MKHGRNVPLNYFTDKTNYRWYILTTVLFGAFMSALDANLMNIINPVLEKVFFSPLSIVEWGSLSYLLTLTILLPVFGKISDIIGRKTMYNMGFTIFIIGSAMVGLSFNMIWFVLWRIVQSIGATMLQSNSIAIITANFPSEERGKAIGIQGAIQAIGMAVGPSFGGFLVTYMSWRYAFYINVPVGLIGTVLAYFVLPRNVISEKKERIDYLGISLFTGFLGLFLIDFTEGMDIFGLYGTIFIGIVSLVLLLLFIRVELKNAFPLIDLSLFKSRVFTAGNFSGLISYLSLNGLMFISPFFLEFSLGLNGFLAGVMLIAIPASMSIMAPISGYLADRHGYVKFSVLGMTLMSIGFLLLLFVNLQVSLFYILLSFVMVGVGMGMFTPPNNTTVMSVASAGKLSLVGGLLNMMRSIGLIFGISIATLFYDYDLARNKALTLANSNLSAYKVTIMVLLIVTIVGVIFSSMKGQVKHKQF
ncbi:MAG: MFS transporter [Thermoplasmata archaeon]